ncbi:MAG: glycosyltransferase family 39 protein [Patescibacteria group bacterium]
MKPPYWLLLSLSVLFFIGTTAFWIFKNNLPPAWDQAHYLEASEIMRQALINEGIFSFLTKTTTILAVKAPLIAILPLPLYLAFGSLPHVALVINLIFMAVFYIFFYKLTTLIFNGRIALLSIVVISTMPLFYGLVRYFLVEFGLATIVVAWLYFLLKSEFLTNKKYLLLLGLFFGLGMLMKFHFFIFIAGPALIVIYGSLAKLGLKIFNFKNIIIFALPALVITLPWYLRNIMTLLWKAKRASDPQLLGNLYYGPPFSFNNLYLSALDFINYVISGYWFLVLLILAAIYLYKSKRIHINYFFLSWFLIPFIILYFGPNKDYRLMLPLLPPIAIFIGRLTDTLLAKNTFVFLAIVFLPIIIYLNTAIFDAKLIEKRATFGPLIITDKKIGGYVQASRFESWPITEMLAHIAKNNRADKYRTVVLASEDEIFNINSLKYYAVLERLPLIIKSASYFPEGTDYQTIEEVINQGDYLIMKTGGMTGPDNLNKFNGLILQNLDYQKWEELPHNIRLPDGGKINIWKKS